MEKMAKNRFLTHDHFSVYSLFNSAGSWMLEIRFYRPFMIAIMSDVSLYNPNQFTMEKV